MVYLSSSRMLVMSAQVIQLVNTRTHTQRRLRSVCVPFSLQLFWHEAAYKRYQRHQNTMYFLSCMAKQPMNNTLTANKFIREVIWCSERGALLQVVLVCETIVYYGASK